MFVYMECSNVWCTYFEHFSVEVYGLCWPGAFEHSVLHTLETHALEKAVFYITLQPATCTVQTINFQCVY